MLNLTIVIVRLTFDWNDELGDDWEDFLAASSGQQVINALQRKYRSVLRGSSQLTSDNTRQYLHSKEDIRMLSLSETVEEER